MSNSIKIRGGVSVSNPQAFLTGRLKAGVVTLTLGTESVNRLKFSSFTVYGKPVIIGDCDIFSTTGVLPFMKVLVTYGTIVFGTCALEWATEFLLGSISA